jgi:4'-phosphopantetheinyl transferase
MTRPAVSPEAPAIELRRFELDVDPEELTALRELLSPEELARAARLRFARDRARFIAGRAMVRRALAGRAGCEPAGLAIAAAPQGKPYLPDHPELRFNATGSGGKGLLAIADGIEVGVDLELSEPAFDGLEVARQFFRRREVESLESLEAAERQAAFLRCWTRKEAYVKALGTGLRSALDSFEVSLLAGEPAELRWCAAAGETERWTLVDCTALAGGITAALCYETRPGVRLRMVGAGR